MRATANMRWSSLSLICGRTIVIYARYSEDGVSNMQGERNEEISVCIDRQYCDEKVTGHDRIPYNNIGDIFANFARRPRETGETEDLGSSEIKSRLLNRSHVFVGNLWPPLISEYIMYVCWAEFVGSRVSRKVQYG